jgi:hypothetical protein
MRRILKEALVRMDDEMWSSRYEQCSTILRRGFDKILHGILILLSKWLPFTKKLPTVKRMRTARKVRAVQKIRAESAFLRAMHERFSTTFKGSRCLVIGSAPGVVVPNPLPGDRCICVNGSPYVASGLGINNPDLTIICGVTTGLKTAKSKATIPIWKGLHTQEILFHETGDSEQHARNVIDAVGFGYDRFTKISSFERAAIIGEVCGLELGIGNRNNKASTGVFAATLAAWVEAEEIIMCGFSLKGGHSYIDGTTPRYNVTGDAVFFRLAKKLEIGLKTTSVEIHETFAVPLAD